METHDGWLLSQTRLPCYPIQAISSTTSHRCSTLNSMLLELKHAMPLHRMSCPVMPQQQQVEVNPQHSQRLPTCLCLSRSSLPSLWWRPPLQTRCSSATQGPRPMRQPSSSPGSTHDCKVQKPTMLCRAMYSHSPAQSAQQCHVAGYHKLHQRHLQASAPPASMRPAWSRQS